VAAGTKGGEERRTCEDWMRDASLFDIWFLSDIVVVSGLV
jgi:hypothetical protein